MKTFKDLKFKPHKISSGIHARLDFDNGYSVSVVQGEFFYTNNQKEYELAVMKNGDICYDTPITDDVLGYLSKEEVTKYMIQIQELPILNN